jgi:hypothetical protein
VAIDVSANDSDVADDDTLAEVIAEPRSSVKYENVFPGDGGWR